MEQPFSLIGPLQTSVMNYFWSLDKGTELTVKMVHAYLNALKPRETKAYTTILTVMRNLAKRGMLEQIKQEGSRTDTFVFLVSKEDYRDKLCDIVLLDFFDGCKRTMTKTVKDL